MNKQVTMRPPLELIPQPFGSLVFERCTGRYLPFDQEATDLLAELASEPIDRVIAKRTAQRTEVARFYERLYRRGFFTLDGRFAGRIRAVRAPARPLAGPLAVHLAVTTACNLNCSHCFAGAVAPEGRRLEIADLESLFGQMAGIGSFRLGLTGGEPLLRNDLFEIIDLAIAHGLSPCVTTNGTLLDESAAREFGRRELLWLNVSLEGASPLTNDRIRGPGSFARVMENLRRLARHARFSLAFTLMKTNLGEVRECAELAFRIGAQSAVFRPLYPVGSARKHPELMPTFAEYTAALQSLTGLRLQDEDHECPATVFSPANRADSQTTLCSNGGCGAGTTVCSISSTGDLSPCSFLGAGFVIGNLRSRSLADLWSAAEMQPFRGEHCTRTGKARLFKEGCRARALWLNGAADAADPWLAQAGTKALRETTESVSFL
jgi:mycofactocin biosynthetic radical S-adenosylmethionine protein MftC